MEIPRSTILVTGGTGSVGRTLVQKLIADGYSVRVISRGGKQLEHARISMHLGRITSLNDLKLAMQGCTAVFHCAAEKNDPKQMTSVNVSATKLLFHVAMDSRVTFFCHMSSVGVVGKTDHRVVDESTPCNPTNQYEASKYAAEKIVSQGFDGCSVVILRPTNIFGVDSVRRLSSNSLRSKMGVLLKGNENAHLVYVKDVAAAALYFFQASSANPVEKYIVSSDEEIGNTHREVQAFLSSRIQTAPQPFAVSAPLLIPYYLRRMKHGKTNRGDLVYSSRKISAAGFRFQYGLQRGLCDAVNSILQPPFCR